MGYYDDIWGISNDTGEIQMKRITKPGVYKGLSYAEYDAIPAIRSSYLKKFLHCPASALVPDDDTPSLSFGIAAHTIILEGVRVFESLYHVMPKFEGDKRTSKYKLLKGKVIAEAALKGIDADHVLPYDDFEAIVNMKVNILKHPTANLLIGKNEPELSVVWKDAETKLLCKARFDVSPYMDIRAIPDLKTTTNCSEHGFAKEISKFHYYLSAAMYLEGASIALKEKIDLFVVIAVEKKPPYKLEVHELSPEYIERGTVAFHKALRKEKKCREAKFYEPWNNGGIIVQEPPPYLLAE
jgi:exodeoxyribonuclease VIII